MAATGHAKKTARKATGAAASAHGSQSGNSGAERPGAVQRTQHALVHSSIHWSRFVAMSCGGKDSDVTGTTAYFVKSSGRAASGITGYTYMLSGMSSWNALPRRKSMSLPASFACFVPFRTPTNSSCRKHDDGA